MTSSVNGCVNDQDHNNGTQNDHPIGNFNARYRCLSGKPFHNFPPDQIDRLSQRGGLLPKRKENRSLEFMAACVARPSVPYAALVEMFGPVGRKQTHTALGTDIVAEGRQARMRRHLGVRDHRFSFPAFPSLDTSSQLKVYPGSVASARHSRLTKRLACGQLSLATVAVGVRPSLKWQMQQGISAVKPAVARQWRNELVDCSLVISGWGHRTLRSPYAIQGQKRCRVPTSSW